MEILSVSHLQHLARARRRELHLSQESVAEKAGVSRKWLSAFERGRASAAELPLVLRLTAALGLCVEVRPVPVDATVLADVVGATATVPDATMRADNAKNDAEDENYPVDLHEHLRNLAQSLRTEQARP